MRFFVWLFRAFIFFTLFAFALNNQQSATVRWFFGIEWHAPMVIVVLIAFAAGCALGVLAMVPSWWRQRQVARKHAPVVVAAPPPPPTSSVMPSEFDGEPQQHPPRDGV